MVGCWCGGGRSAAFGRVVNRGVRRILSRFLGKISGGSDALQIKGCGLVPTMKVWSECRMVLTSVPRMVLTTEVGGTGRDNPEADSRNRRRTAATVYREPT